MITTDNVVDEFLGNGVTTVFPSDVYGIAATQFEVYLGDADLTGTLLTLTTDYSISNLADVDEDGVVVTMVVPPANGEVVRLYRRTDAFQQLNVTASRAYDPQGIETQLDLLTMALQEAQAAQLKALRVRDEIVPMTPEVGAGVEWDGTKFIAGPTSTAISGAQAAAVAANASAVIAQATNFASRALFVTAHAAVPGVGLSDGQIVRAAGLEYRRLAASAAISDLLGWVPNGQSTPFHFGALGDGVTDDRPAFALLNDYGGPAYMPKPPASYTVSSAINLDKPGITADPTCSWEALTDSGQITWVQNLFTHQTPPAPTHRFSGRVLLGDAAFEMAAGWTPGVDGNDRGIESWYADQSPIFGGYTHRDAMLAVANGKGTTAIAVSARASDQFDPLFTAPIGLASFVHNDGNGEPWSSVWGMIVEGRASQLEGNTFGLEVALGNISGVTKTITPYNATTGAGQGGVIGLWMAGGGDATIGTPSNASNNSPMVVLKNQSNAALDGGWATGIVFTKDALKGTDGSAASATFATAITMGRHQKLQWNEPTTGVEAFSITSKYTSVTDAARWEGFAGAGTYGLRMNRISDGVVGINLRSTSGNVDTQAVLQAETTAVRLTAEGPGANADILLAPKGTGRVRFGTRIASADVPVTGYIEIADAGGTVRRLAVVG